MKQFFPLVPVAGLLVITAGCMDNNYDLSDIDTTTEIKVNNLILPVNLGTMHLSTAIDLNEDENQSIVVEEVDGKKIYVFNTDGDFVSKEISINSFSVTAPTNLTPSSVNVNQRAGLSISEFSYDVEPMQTTFNYQIDDVDPKVKSVISVETPGMTLSTTLDVPYALIQKSQKIRYEDLKLEFPKGLHGRNGGAAKCEVYIDGQLRSDINPSYNPATGVVDVPTFESTSHQVMLAVTARDIEMDEAGVVLRYGHFDYTGNIKVTDGVVTFVANPGESFPNSFTFEAYYDVTSFDIQNFTGAIVYDVEDLNFDPVDLSDLPDFLAEEGTSLKIANPQLYLSIYNTCAPYHLTAHTGLDITPLRHGVATEGTLVMNDPINVGFNADVGPYQFAISPEGTDLEPIADYAGAQKLLFSDLGSILYGDGIPSQINVAFPNPYVNGTAYKFPLKIQGQPASMREVPAVHGDYKFRAPLALADGSKIVYSGTKDDWSSDDLEDLYIDLLEINTTVTSTIPLEVQFQARLMDKAGRKIGHCTPVTLPANAPATPITLTITPSAGNDYLTDIDGIFYEVWAISNEDDANPADVPALSPDQTLTLSDTKAKINGKYVTKP